MYTRTRIALAMMAAALLLALSACNLIGYKEGEVTEIEQELNSTELTVYCDGEMIDVDIPKTDKWESGDVYGCEVRPEDQR